MRIRSKLLMGLLAAATLTVGAAAQAQEQVRLLTARPG